MHDEGRPASCSGGSGRCTIARTKPGSHRPSVGAVGGEGGGGGACARRKEKESGAAGERHRSRELHTREEGGGVHVRGCARARKDACCWSARACG
jgi:hypothetical protein